MKKLFFIAFFTLFASNLLTAQTKEEKKKIKEEKSEVAYKATKELIDSKSFVFNATWLNTNGGRRIDVQSGINFIEVKNDSVTGSLQFFGTSTTGSFNKSPGIEFDNVPKNYSVKYNDKKRKATISFDVKNKAESYNITISVHKNGHAFTNISSSSRSFISYEGAISKFIED